MFGETDDFNYFSNKTVIYRCFKQAKSCEPITSQRGLKHPLLFDFKAFGVMKNFVLRNTVQRRKFKHEKKIFYK
jgi:hypothetical protein